mmetsp:Transcript_37684/g.82123  ORF Transcript_37684/g.82123 Transcript_37684/m.82123 type:complete len:388 (-) Transcript_37684:1842-3005(-)
MRCLLIVLVSFALLRQARFAGAFTTHTLRTHHVHIHHATRDTSVRSCSSRSSGKGRDGYGFSESSTALDDKVIIKTDCSSSRRSIFRRIAEGISIAVLTSTIQPAREAVAASNSVRPYGTPDRPVLILGGNGRTAMQVAESLATGGTTSGQPMNVVVTTRTGKDPFSKIKLADDVKERIVPYTSSGVDVRNLDSIRAALKETNAGAVVYAASASKSGGNAAEVDGDGPANAAMACSGGGCKLVLVSALALDRPDSKSYQITNTMGGFIDKIMDEKLRGEDEVRKAMGGRGKGDYVIIRPGPLLSGKSKNGAVDIELNQGDTVGGGLSRDELAGVVVGALQAGVRGVTVECYRSKTATSLQPEFSVPSGNELRASTYAGLFDGAKKDV